MPNNLLMGRMMRLRCAGKTGKVGWRRKLRKEVRVGEVVRLVVVRVLKTARTRRRYRKWIVTEKRVKEECGAKRR